MSPAVVPLRAARPTDADLDLVRAVMAGPHDELEVAMLVIGYRDRLLAPLRYLVRLWLASSDRELVAAGLVISHELDRATGVMRGES